jgi:hypothetical protein
MTDSIEHLANVIKHLVGKDTKQAEQSFHDYLTPKMKNIINPPVKEIDIQQNNEEQ